jgi:hypothetical protein
MGDRTTVVLTVLKSQSEKAKKFFDCNSEEENVSDEFVDYSFYEVNYGSLGFLNDLQDAGIAFNSNWGHGSEYGPGTEYLRFLPDGTHWREEVSDSYINPDLDTCMKLLDKPEELCIFIRNHYERITPPSWDNQEEYAKLFLARQLITPKE